MRPEEPHRRAARPPERGVFAVQCIGVAASGATVSSVAHLTDSPGVRTIRKATGLDRTFPPALPSRRRHRAELVRPLDSLRAPTPCVPRQSAASSLRMCVLIQTPHRRPRWSRGPTPRPRDGACMIGRPPTRPVRGTLRYPQPRLCVRA